jgi:hypothetical protein
VFVEVNNGRSRAFLRKKNRDRASDPAVAPVMSAQLSASDIITGPGFGLWPHLVFRGRAAVFDVVAGEVFSLSA